MDGVWSLPGREDTEDREENMREDTGLASEGQARTGAFSAGICIIDWKGFTYLQRIYAR